MDFVASHAHSRHCLYHLVGISIHGLIFRSRFPDYCRSSVLAVCRAAGHSYQEIKWHSATWGTVRGPRAPRAFVWYSNSHADLFQGPSPPHYKDTDRLECEEEHKERLSYMSAEELKSAKEVYSRVAVIDIEISVGIRNIYIRRSKKLVLSPTRSGREHTILRRANIQSTSTSFRGKWNEEIRFRSKQTSTYNSKRLSDMIQEKLGMLTSVMSPVPVANKSQITPLRIENTSWE